MTSPSAVVKIGTSSVTDDQGGIAQDVLNAVAADVVALRRDGWSVVVVTSGAITAGWADVGRGRHRPTDSTTLQAVSAVGQPLLMDAWRRAFGAHEVAVGQVLLAPLDFSHRGQYLHARSTLAALDALAAIPRPVIAAIRASTGLFPKTPSWRNWRKVSSGAKGPCGFATADTCYFPTSRAIAS